MLSLKWPFFYGLEGGEVNSSMMWPGPDQQEKPEKEKNRQS